VSGESVGMAAGSYQELTYLQVTGSALVSSGAGTI